MRGLAKRLLQLWAITAFALVSSCSIYATTAVSGAAANIAASAVSAKSPVLQSTLTVAVYAGTFIASVIVVGLVFFMLCGSTGIALWNQLKLRKLETAMQRLQSLEETVSEHEEALKGIQSGAARDAPRTGASTDQP